VTLTYMLDTNIISEPLRPVPNPTILASIERYQDEIAIAAIIWHELWFGCWRLPASARRAAIETYLTKVVAPAVPILAYDQRAAEWHARERTRLADIGKTPPFADGQIAATAVVHNLTLITLNRDDFIAFQGLQIDDWLLKKENHT
jgi:tRNA(fMet)-specific endonuclease VapC